MRWPRTLIVAGAVLAMSGALAKAADMPGYQPAPPPDYRPVLVDFGKGWYVRGDIGERWGVFTLADSAAPFPRPVDDILDNVFFGGVGFGIKSQWLRTDFTVDYASPMKYQGTITAPGDTTAKIQATTALINGYIDLGTWYRLSPYIGAGAGVAYVRALDYSSPGAPPFSGDVDNSQWNFAYAGMAGVAYAISYNLMVDVGYRYLNIGNVKTGRDTFGEMTINNVASHEVRIGLRWSFDDPRYLH